MFGRTVRKLPMATYVLPFGHVTSPWIREVLSCTLFLSPVDFAMAPIRTAGTDMTIQPTAAAYDNIWARVADLADRTR